MAFPSLAVAIILAAAAETPTQDQWLPVWMQASRQTEKALANLSDFTCVQDTARVTRSGKKRDHVTSDGFQVEVGIINRRETYGWPGQELKADNPAELAAFGVFTSGELYYHLRKIVAERTGLVRSVEFRPETEEWVFHVHSGSLSSSISVGWPVGHKVDFQATVIVNGRRCVRQLELFIPDAPVISRIRSMRLWLEYGCRWDEFDAIPVKSTALVEKWDGSQVTVDSRWHDCTRFSASSQLVADDRPLAPSAIPSQWLTVETSKFSTELPRNVSLDKLTAGSILPLVLKKPIEISNGRTLPAGTSITARVIGNDAVQSSDSKIVTIRLESYVEEGFRVAFRAKCLRVKGHPSHDSFRPQGLAFSRYAFDPSRVTAPMVTEIVYAGTRTDAMVVTGASDRQLPAGMVFDWEILPAVEAGTAPRR